MEKNLNSEKELIECLKNPLIQEAIYLASPDLYEELQKEQGNLHNIDKSTLYASERYISRMSTRCTPFGLFAGCGFGNINGNNTDIVLDKQPKRITRLDMYYLNTLCELLLSIQSIRNNVKYYPSNSLYKIGSKYRYVEPIKHKESEEYRITELYASHYLTDIFKFAQKGKDIKSLVTMLINKGIEESDASEFIEKLIDSQILITKFYKKVTGEDLLAYTINQLDNLDITNNLLLSSLKKIQFLISQLDSNNNDNLKLYTQIISIIAKIGANYDKKHLFQVDTNWPTLNASLSNQIVNELNEAITFLNKITVPGDDGVLKQFQREFHKRYEDQEIPLMEALDPEMGIGYPPTNNVTITSPLIDDLILPRKETTKQNEKFTSIQSLLLKRMYYSQKKQKKEIVLTDDDVKGIEANWNDLPPTMSVMFEVIRAKQNNILIKLRSCSGSSGANLLGRFSHTSKEIDQLVKTIAKKEQELNPAAIIAEIVHLPESKVGNILYRPHIRDYELLFISNSDLPNEQKILLSDLTISVKQNRLIIRSNKLKKEILPSLTTAHNYHNNPTPIYRFLCDMQKQSGRGGLTFSWGKQIEDKFSFLPRVRYKNIILSAKTWFIDIDELTPLFDISKDNILIKSIKEWRNKHDIPKCVLISDYDNDLFLDLENPLIIRSAFSIIKRRKRIKIIEFIFDLHHSIIKDSNGNPHTNECITIIYKNSNDK